MYATQTNLNPAPQQMSALSAMVSQHLGSRAVSVQTALGEVTLTVKAADYTAACKTLRDTEGLLFDTLIDLCGVDYQEYRAVSDDPVNENNATPRFAVVLHLLSVACNQRIRLVVFCPNNDLPQVDSVISVWSAANWYEREAFDFFGIIFEGHDDLRRILTDYGFVGHPFRKDFPVSGYVEMRYDPEQKRVIYQPVTIEPRELAPRVIREDHYGGFIPE
jgi:NADH-quinone oxidoreductase subunit C